MTGPFDLDGPSVGPAAQGSPQQLVVLLHGYGADGNDLIELAPHWSDILPQAAFFSPHAPFPCEAAPFGRQWFGFEGRDEKTLFAGAEAAGAILDKFLDLALAEFGLPASKLALVGFSQGTMMALHVALRRSHAVAGIVGYSGALIAPERLAEELRSRPPVLLVHGDADPVVPFPAMAAAAQTLTALGVPVETERRPGLPHAIDPTGLAKGGRFLVEAFAKAR
ncbi:MAG: alpha/beta hydrolase [Pseudomonadota bacterium]